MSRVQFYLLLLLLGHSNGSGASVVVNATKGGVLGVHWERTLRDICLQLVRREVRVIEDEVLQPELDQLFMD